MTQTPNPSSDPNRPAGGPNDYDAPAGYPGPPQQTHQGGYYPPQYGQQQAEGQSAATTSLVLGIIGIFAVGIILGPLAIYFASKAERNGVPATAGKVLGWIVTILYAIAIIIGVIFVVFVIAAASSANAYGLGVFP